MAAASQASFVQNSHSPSPKDKIEQLRKLLQHWQTLDAEYEALKEEVESLPEEATAKDLQNIQADFNGELILKKDIDEIFGQQKRSAEQIVNILDRRIDCASQNAANLQTQLRRAELALSEDDAPNNQDATYEGTPAVTEIIEELDDKDNVVSYRLNRPADDLPLVKSALEKAGVDAPIPEATPSGKPSNPTVAPETTPVQRTTESLASPSPDASQPVRNSNVPVSRMATRVENIMKTAKQQENISQQSYVLPESEDPEDADLRQQMLRYSMGEMSAVVAELSLEDDEDSDEDFDDDVWIEKDEEDIDFGDDDDDEEDKYGRFTGRIITDKYQRRMLELETRLGVKSRFTQEKEDSGEEESIEEGEGIGRIRIKQEPTALNSSLVAPTKSIVKEKHTNKRQPKKGVRFAPELDIAPEPEVICATPVVKGDASGFVEPVSELIVERTAAPRASVSSLPAARKQSRFKQSVAVGAAQSTSAALPRGPLDVPESFLSPRRGEEMPIPTGPQGVTIADTLVEKETVSLPADPTDIDDAMLHLSVAEEHQRLRGRFIQRDGGGFLEEREDPVQSLDEMDDGGVRRMSRFKAARLSKQ